MLAGGAEWASRGLELGQVVFGVLHVGSAGRRQPASTTLHKAANKRTGTRLDACQSSLAMWGTVAKTACGTDGLNHYNWTIHHNIALPLLET